MLILWLKGKQIFFQTILNVGERRSKMNTYIMLSRFSPEAFDDPKHFLELAEQVSKKIKSDCPGVRWKDSYATLGRFDVVDIVEAADPKEIEKVAMIIRAFGHSTTETLLGTPWRDFLDGLKK
jgi:uncharacterized protein with GYD domain